MIAREILDVCKINGLEHITLKCLPADYHHHPAKIVPHLERSIQEARAEGVTNIFIGYADCGTGGEIDRLCARENIGRLEGPHCFSFYYGNKAFEAADDRFMTHFIMTDFLARHFENFMLKPLGLIKNPELKEIYFAHYTHLSYFAQAPTPELIQNAQDAAKYLELDFNMIHTGYGDLTQELMHIS